jgi:peptide subunit release factor 1 (eRF1)
MNVLQPQAIKELAERTVREGSPVLSVYLNVDVTDLSTRRSGHKLALDGMLKDLEFQIDDEAKLRHFREDSEWIRQKVEFSLPKGKSLLLFCDVSESFFFEEDLPVRMATQAWFGNTPYVRPLLESMDEYERYGLVLVDREKARFFVISMGIIEEVSDVLQEPPVKHRSTAGSDHMRSQMIFQRRAATWSGWFLKDVSDILLDLIKKYYIDRILLAGSEDITAELQRLLPRALAPRVVDRVRISSSARASEVLDLSFPVIEKLEREREMVMVEDLVTIAQKTEPGVKKAVLGHNATLDAVNQGRVHRLLYSSGVKLGGYRCRSCEVLLDQAPADSMCPYCSKPLELVEDMLWLASERVLEMGGRSEEIRGAEARKQLDAAGKAGAFLR